MHTYVPTYTLDKPKFEKTAKMIDRRVLREASWGFPKFPKLNSEQKTFRPRQCASLGKTENSDWGAHISRHSDTKLLPCQLDSFLK